MKHNPNSYTHLSQRSQHQLGQFRDYQKSLNHFSFLLNPSDLGVSLNGGRSGSRFAPEALIQQFKKLHTDEHIKKWETHLISDQKIEKDSFVNSQKHSITLIQELLKTNPSSHLLQLGGGHDHIFPLLLALDSLEKRTIHVINLDAHLDTRNDKQSSSGTPFRQFQQQAQNVFKLTQIGIHPFANTKSNYEEMKEMNILSLDEFRKNPNIISNLINPDETTVLSIDCDCMDSSYMSAVSAPNHYGFSKKEITQILNTYLEISTKRIIGFYEYNPLYDDLALSNGRFIANLMFQIYRKQ